MISSKPDWKTILKQLVFILVVSCFSLLTQAKTILWATPTWENYTSENGVGFYHDLLATVFDQSDFQIEVQIVPWKRALASVLSHQAHMTGVDVPGDGLLASEQPIFRSIEAVVFRRNEISPWTGIESLKAFRGVWSVGYLDFVPEPYLPNFQGTEVETRAQAIHMLTSNRGIHYYFDNLDQLKRTMSAASETMDEQEWRTEVVLVNDVFWLFQNTSDGLAVKKQFDQGFQHAYCSGELLSIYQKWSLAMEFPVELDICS